MMTIDRTPLRRVLTVLGLLTVPVWVVAQTATDACGYNPGNQYPVNTSCVFATFNKPDAFTSAASPASCSAGAFDDAWGWFTATNTVTTITYDPDDNHRPIIHVFTGACGSLTEVGCNNSGGNGVDAVLTINTTIGQNYMVRVQRHGTNAGMNGRLCISSPQAFNACSLNSWSQYAVNTSCTFTPFNKHDLFTATYNPGTCNAGNFDDAWGWFTATSTTTVVTFDPAASQRPILHVFSGACGSLTQVACHDAGSNGVNAEVALTTVPGQNYYFRVQLHNANTAMDGSVCIWSPATSNTCAYSTGNQFSVTTSCTPQPFQKPEAFTASFNPGTCGAGAFDDAWAWFTATSTTTIVTFDPDLSHRPILHVFTGACGSLTQVACHDAGSDGANAEVLLNTTPGVNYAIRIQRQGTNAAMDGNLCIWVPRTTNNCAFAANNQFTPGTTCSFQPFQKPALYTNASNPGTCGAGAFDDAWAWFTATGTSTAITFDPDLSHRPILHVFSGACGSLTQLACHDAGSDGANAHVVIPTTPGQNYVIRVQRQGSNAEMNGGLCVWNPPAFDECGGATLLPVLENCFLQNFTNAHATRSTTTPSPSCGGTFSNTTRDVWFRFTAPASGRVLIETTAGTMTDGAMQLYSGGCGSLTAVECDDNDGPGNMPLIDRRCDPLTPFATYYIRFWGVNGQQGTFNICVRGWSVFPAPKEDCIGGATICSNQNIVNNTNWRGCTADLNAGNRGCLVSNERQGTWYYFSPQYTGTIAFTITPVDENNNPVNVDYDFAIWGPMSSIVCPPAGPPLRCSYAYPPAAGTWLTGLAAGNADTSEPASGPGVNGFVAPITVGVGDVGATYIMYVDNFTSNGQSFNLAWTLSPSNILDCTILPVELVGFRADARADHVAVQWTTQVENGTDRFIVERSADGFSFEPIAVVDGAGWSQQGHEYAVRDEEPFSGPNYYRLLQVGLDGTQRYSGTAHVVYRKPLERFTVYPNPARDRATIDMPASDAGAHLAQLVDASGRIVRQWRFISEGGAGSSDLDLAGIDTGSYVLLLSGADGAPIGSAPLVHH